MNISNLKIGVRLGIGFAVTLVLLCSIAAIGFYNIAALDGGIDKMADDRYPKTVQANAVIDAINIVGRNLRNAVLYSGAEQQRAVDAIAPQRKIISENLDKLVATVKSDKGIAIMKKIQDARTAYVSTLDKALELLKADKRAEIIAMLQGEMRKTQADYYAAVNELIKFQSDAMTQAGKDAAKAATDAERLLLILSGIAIVLTILVGWVITRSITGPTAKLVEGANKMAAGDFGFKLEIDSKDEVGALANSVRAMQGAVQAMIADADMLAGAAAAGKLSTRADASKHQGDFNRVVSGVNQTLDAVIGPLNVAASYVDQISKGAIPAKITDPYNGDFNTLKNNLNVAIDSINALIADAAMLSQAAVAGKLETRADAAKHQGDFRKIVEGVNKTLDAVIGPLNVAASYVDQISKGAIPAKITDSYNGDFNTLKNNLNVAIDSINALIADAVMLSQAAVAGKLATRADAAKHQGDYRKIVSGVNDTLDAVIGPLNVAASYVDQISKGAIPAKITDSYNGDFNTLKNNLNVCIDSVNALVADAGMLSQAAVAGKLATRADAAKHQGDFRKIVEGVNQTLDAVIGPLNVAASYVDQISKGAIPAKITDSYNGDFNTLKNNLNVCIDAVNNLVTDSAAMSQATVAGNFEARADAARHQGDFRKIVEGLNQVMEVSNTGLNEVVRVLGALSKGDLTEKITAEYQGTFKRLKDDSNMTVEKLTEIVNQIKVLVDAALRGDFTVRGDADKYQNDFRAMVDGLNRLMQTSDTGLNEVVRVLGALAKGDLTEKITNEYEGTFKRLKDDSNTTVDKLTEIVTSIKESTESINVASKEIASGNTDLSSRTEEQASSLEETASSMEELTSTVKQNAENAKQANQLAAGASEVAVKGGTVVGQVVTTMSSINESSKKIVDIISVIDGIAFQTNILALNAAVEAARAGEQGRGFAVVATEVRTLAQRSAAAAKEIKELIGDSVEKVGAGTKLVDEAGKTMEEIVASVKRVTDIMAEITAASQEQSAGIEQVNTAITQMDEVTQQNAALVEQAAAAAESMEEQAGNLATAVSVFRMSQQTGGAQASKPAAIKHAGLPAPRKPATITQHPAAKGNGQNPPAKAKPAKASGGEEWTEF